MSGPTENEGRKVASLRELPQSIEPARDLWPGIESRLVGTAAKPRAARPRWLAAAAMVACLAIGVWIGRGLLPGGATRTAPSTAAIPPAAQGLAPTAFDAAYVSDPRYARERAALVRE